jgi:predicted small lipoprotein YifL
MVRSLYFALLAFALTGLTGCGSSGPYKYVPASGKITYEDGTPIPLGSMRLLFVAIDAPPIDGAYPRPAMAHVDASGEFAAVTSYKHGDGLIPGRHKVVIQAPTESEGRPVIPKSCISEATTPLVVDTADVPLVIKVPKP